MKNIPLVLSLCLLCVSCTSRPPEVIASRPLVEDAQTQGGISTQDAALDAFFADARVGAIYSNDTMELRVLDIYSSALGSYCVQYETIEASMLVRKIACKDTPSWVVYPWMSSGISNYKGGA